MTMMFGKGNLSWNGLTLTSDCVVESAEWDLSATECVPMTVTMSSAPVEFEASVGYINNSLLSQMCGTPSYDNTEFVWHYAVPIWIQARWHKKARIRKKWLKRYGMKFDVVTAAGVASVVNWDTQSNTWDFLTDACHVEYLWKPHQKRREIKIEWVRV